MGSGGVYLDRVIELTYNASHLGYAIHLGAVRARISIMQDSKFVGVCLLLSSLILAAAIIYHGKQATDNGRYQFQPASGDSFWIMDTANGQVHRQGSWTTPAK